MKGKTSSNTEGMANNNSSKDVNIKTSASNLFLNLIIIALGLLIIFLGYSLYLKIAGAQNIAVENKQLASAIIQLEVLNGCGVSGAAEKFTNYLRQKDFDVVQTGNYISYNIDDTMVIDRTGNLANAEKVAEALGISRKNIIQQINDDYFLDVTLIVGKDYFQLTKKLIE